MLHIFWTFRRVATIKPHYGCDGPGPRAPRAFRSHRQQLLEAIWPFELPREIPQVLIKQFMDHWPKDMTVPHTIRLIPEMFLSSHPTLIKKNLKKMAGRKRQSGINQVVLQRRCSYIMSTVAGKPGLLHVMGLNPKAQGSFLCGAHVTRSH